MNKTFKNMDKILLVVTFIFFAFGLLMIFSASSVSTILRYHEPSYYFFVKQLIFIIVGVLFGVAFVMRFPTKGYHFLAFPLVILIIVSLLGLFVYGKITGGAISWYNLKFFSVQPSEFAKSILIIFYACYYQKLSEKKNAFWLWYLIPLIISGVIVLLVAKQPDLGSALIILGISLAMFLSVPGIKKSMKPILKIFLVFAIIVGAYFIISGKSILTDAQKKRFEFTSPCDRYTESTGYQACNGLIAMSSGGLFGVGLGNSTQKYLYLPESHTDYIFPIIVEELGLVTGVIVILFYGIVLHRLIKMTKEAENLRCSLICYGTYVYIALHILINLLGILTLIPLTGVPLPFLSYGGSFTLNIVTMLFLSQKAYCESKVLKLHREIKEL